MYSSTLTVGTNKTLAPTPTIPTTSSKKKPKTKNKKTKAKKAKKGKLKKVEANEEDSAKVTGSFASSDGKSDKDGESLFV